ncbi:hypothetical protein CRYUN_Cryun34aG0051900 [Craigia yunnanensis]
MAVYRSEHHFDSIIFVSVDYFYVNLLVCFNRICISLPISGCSAGFVLGKNMSGKRKARDVSEVSSDNWEMKAKFDKLTYWNHDSPPSKDDTFLRSFHWFAVAEALHKPVKAEDLAAASAALEKN